MGLPYLKTAPEEAIQVIDECIISGYELKDQISSQYTADKTAASERILGWRKLSNDWADNVIERLSGIYVSEKELYNFRDARGNGMMTVGMNMEVSGVIAKLEARIDKLNQYDNYIRNQFNVHLEIIGRDKVVQNGEAGKIEIRN